MLFREKLYYIILYNIMCDETDNITLEIVEADEVTLYDKIEPEPELES